MYIYKYKSKVGSTQKRHMRGKGRNIMSRGVPSWSKHRVVKKTLKFKITVSTFFCLNSRLQHHSITFVVYDNKESAAIKDTKRKVACGASQYDMTGHRLIERTREKRWERTCYCRGRRPVFFYFGVRVSSLFIQPYKCRRYYSPCIICF